VVYKRKFMNPNLVVWGAMESYDKYNKVNWDDAVDKVKRQMAWESMSRSAGS
jgi:hypothetical protein